MGNCSPLQLWKGTDVVGFLLVLWYKHIAPTDFCRNWICNWKLNQRHRWAAALYSSVLAAMVPWEHSQPTTAAVAIVVHLSPPTPPPPSQKKCPPELLSPPFICITELNLDPYMLKYRICYRILICWEQLLPIGQIASMHVVQLLHFQHDTVWEHLSMWDSPWP